MVPEGKKIRVNSRYILVIRNKLFRRDTDGVLWRCVFEAIITLILISDHDSICGAHFSEQLTGQKILRACYFWPTLFQDAHVYVRKYDACQRYVCNDLRIEFPLHASLPSIPFEKWNIDYIKEVHPHSSTWMAYIVVTTEYLTKWAEAKAVRTDTAAHTATFFFENVISRFRCPKILINDRCAHFLNSTIQKMTNRFQIDHRKTIS